MVLIALALFNPGEPSYQGKLLSFWASQLQESDPIRRQKAHDALIAMGDAATRYLMKWVDHRETSFRKWVFKTLKGISITKNWMTSTEMRRANAAIGLGSIGPSAAAAIPSLIRATKDESWIVATRAEAALIQVRQQPSPTLAAALSNPANLGNWLQAASTFSALGSNITPHVAAFLKALPERNLPARFDLIQLLCTKHVEPAVAIPILTGCLKDGEWGIRANTMNAVIVNAIHYDAGSAKKELWNDLNSEVIACLSDTNSSVRGNAIFTVMLLIQYQKLDPNFPNLQQVLLQLATDPDPTVRSWVPAVQKNLRR